MKNRLLLCRGILVVFSLATVLLSNSFIAHAQLKPAETGSTEISIQLEDDGISIHFTRVDVWESLPKGNKPTGDYFFALLGTIQSTDDKRNCIYQRDFQLTVEDVEYEISRDIKSLSNLYDSDYPGRFWGHCVDNDIATNTFLLFDISKSQDPLDFVVFGKSYRVSESIPDLIDSLETPVPTPTPTATPTRTPTPTQTPTYTPAPVSFTVEESIQNVAALPSGAPKTQKASGIVNNEGLEFILQRIDFWDSLPDSSRSGRGIYMALIGTLRQTNESEKRSQCIDTGDFGLTIDDQMIEMSDDADSVADFYDTDYPGWLFSQCVKKDKAVRTFFLFEIPNNISREKDGKLIFRDAPLSLNRSVDEIFQASQSATSTPTYTHTPTLRPTATKTPTATQTPTALPTSPQSQSVPKPQTFTTTTNANANLYDAPDSNAQAVAGTYAGDSINVVKIDSNGEWYQLDNGYWIAAAKTNSPSIGEVTGTSAITEEPTSTAEVGYAIIYEDTLSNIKRTLDIRLNGRISETQLQSLAFELKNSDPTTYDRTFIVYLLPEAGSNAMAWATTHFDPDIEVKIIGLTIEEAQQLTDLPEDYSEAIIGRWLNDGPYIGNKTIIYSEADKFYMDEMYLDGSMGTKELIEVASSEGQKFIDPECCGFGEFFLIGPKGHLQIWDENGQISTALAIEGSSVIAGRFGPTQIPTTPQQAQIDTPTSTQAPIATPTSTATTIPQAPTAMSTATSTPAANTSQIIVAEIVDGDTIKVQIDGVIQTIRYIGIDTPERGKSGYKAAKEANRALVQGQAVTIVRDTSDTDRYDRLLRYVYLPNGVMVNQQLVVQGMAQPAEYPPDTSQAEILLSAAVTASQQRVGFWSGTSSYDGAPAYGITTRKMNIRGGPGTDFAVSGSAEANMPLTIYGRDATGQWVQVQTAKRDGGWIYAPYLTLNINAMSIALASNIPQNRIVATPIPTAAYVPPTVVVYPTQPPAIAYPTPTVVVYPTQPSVVYPTQPPAVAYPTPTAVVYPTQPSVVYPTTASTQPQPAAGGQPFVCTGGCSVAPDPSCSIKGNVNSRKDKIYHTKSSRSYDRTNVRPEEGDRWFCTEQEASDAGFRAPRN